MLCFQSLPDRDLTDVGDEGSRLSGGQRMRVSLARAAYSALINPEETVLVLLDDPFSSLDVQVANKIYDSCICGLLARTTRILATHHVRFLKSCTAVLNLKNGICGAYGCPQDLIPRLSKIREKKLVSQAPDPEQETREDLQFEEEPRRRGTISYTTLQFYIKSIGLILTCTTVLFVALMQISRTSIDAWLAYFVSISSSSVGTPVSGSPMSNFFAVYIGLALINSCFSLIRAFVFAYAGLRGSFLFWTVIVIQCLNTDIGRRVLMRCIIPFPPGAIRIHNQLLDRVLSASLPFFERTSLGQILNRLSSDVYTIDDSLPFIGEVSFTTAANS